MAPCWSRITAINTTWLFVILGIGQILKFLRLCSEICLVILKRACSASISSKITLAFVTGNGLCWEKGLFIWHGLIAAKARPLEAELSVGTWDCWAVCGNMGLEIRGTVIETKVVLEVSVTWTWNAVDTNLRGERDVLQGAGPHVLWKQGCCSGKWLVLMLMVGGTGPASLLQF